MSEEGYPPVHCYSEADFYLILKDRHIASYEKLTRHGFPIMKTVNGTGECGSMTAAFEHRFVAMGDTGLRLCDRCGVLFDIGEYDGMELQAPCCFHPAQPQRDETDLVGTFSCCNESVNSPGCTTNTFHVHSQVLKPELMSFIRTPKPESVSDPRSRKVYALKTESVYTTNGFEVVRMCLMDYRGELVLDTLVKPRGRVLDHMTDITGMDEGIMSHAELDIAEARDLLFNYVNHKTIIIGHRLEVDLRCLGLVHLRVVDTALLFKYAGRKKLTVKCLAEHHLKRQIAFGSDVLDPQEDARTAVELTVVRVKMEIRKRRAPAKWDF